MRITVLDSFTADQGELLWTDLHTLGEVAIHARTAPGDTIARLRGRDAALTNKAPLDAATIAALTAPGAERPLRYIGVMATGTNIVDLAAAKAHGVAVSNVPGYSTESVAQLVFALALHLTHDVAGHSQAVKRGAWAEAPDFCFFTQPLVELAGRTLVVVGMGGIGSAVARIATAFGMRVLAAQVPGSASPGREPLLAALAQADLVTLHCPLTADTRQLVGDGFLAALKPGALLINTSRGGLLDEPAVIRALADGRLGGLGLDVLGAEPPPAGHALLDAHAPWSRRVVATPHIAWGTVAARRRLIAAVARNLAAFAAGKTLNRVA